MPKITSIKKVEPEFQDVRNWYEQNLSPNVIDHNDQRVYEYVYHDGRWGGIFQLTSKGAQQLFKKAKPRSIIDIAALTSIYRPGPLAANVDKLWLKHEKESYDWGHPLINETLKETRGMIVFQESVMALANKVAGFPMEQCDEVRRAIMKRSISGGEAAVAKAQALEDDFVQGAMKNGVPKDIAKNAYEKILYFSGYGFNKSHAVGYAFNSYLTSFLMTYYEEQWLTAYLESMSNNPDDRAKAFSEIRALGYKIVPIDINHAGSGWTILPGKKFMPSFTTVKGIGDAAVVEILQERPYKSIEDVLWDENGFWKHSKFNKRALEALINIGAFQSLDCIGEGKLFSSYAHMYEVIITNIDVIKKRTSKEPQKGREAFFKLAHELRDKVEPWTRKQVALKSIDHFGSVDVGSIIEPQLLDIFANKGVQSIDEYEEKGVYWFCAGGSVIKTTKNKKQYTLLEIMGLGGKINKCFVWGIKSSDLPIEPYSVCFGEVSKSDFGFSTQRWNLRILK